jgi:diguanylate cyclase (GGDEF)-like protein
MDAALSKLLPRQPSLGRLHPRRDGSHLSVRSCLLLLIAACVLPAALFAVMLIARAYLDGRAALIERAQALTRSVLQDVDDQVRSATAALQVLASSPHLASGDLAAFHAQALQVLPYQPGINFVLSDLAGLQKVNTLRGFGVALPPHGNPRLQQAVIASGRPAVSDLFIGGVTRRPLVAVEVPVVVQGRVAYTLAMGFPPDRFTAVLRRLQPEPDWVTVVFDRSGTTLARSHHAERYVGHKASPALTAAAASANQGVVETDAVEGVPVLSAFARSPLTGWTVAVGVPRQALLARLERWIALLAGAMAVTLAMALAVAIVLSRRIATSSDQAAQASLDARVEAQRMAHAASHDPLTHLPNRARFLELLEERAQRCRREGGGRFHVFFVDLDDFKPVNDRHGHQAGDRLLQSVAARLQAGVRGSDVVARLGGDEFAVLLDDVSEQQARSVALALTERLSRPYTIDDLALRVSACIGIAGCPQDGSSPTALLAAADAAMYRAKAAGKGRFEVSGHGGL